MVYIALAVVAALVGLDQIVKIWAIDNLKGQPSIELIKFGDNNILNLTYLENDGAIFGSMSGMRWILIVLPIIMVAGCVFLMFKLGKTNKFITWILALIVAGGIGNLIDRIFRDGKVVDMLEFKFVDFAVFNVADCFITVGAIIMIIYIIFEDIVKKKKENVNLVQTGTTNGE